jgi:hypothetical protein
MLRIAVAAAMVSRTGAFATPRSLVAFGLLFHEVRTLEGFGRAANGGVPDVAAGRRMAQPA